MRKVLYAFLFAALFVFSSHRFVEAASQGQLIIVNKSTNQLAFFENGKLTKIFPVATGRTKSLTPEGKFPIVNKIKNRPYYKEGIPGGDPRNPLGDRWLGLHARGTYGTTYAIHGNHNPSSIGKYVSAGCVRMHNDDIHWLFDRVKLYTDVIIVSSSKSFEQIAADYGYPTEPPIKVVIDGKQLHVSSPPFMESNRVFVPMRSVFQALGATVVWDGAKQTITAAKDGQKMTLSIGSKTATVNGKTHPLDALPRIVNGQTYVPARFVSEALGATVKWDGHKRIVSIASPQKRGPVKQRIDLYVDDALMQKEAFVISGVAFVPVRDVFHEFGISFSYDVKTGTLKAKKGVHELHAVVGTKEAVINGERKELQAPPRIDEGALYFPARALSSTFPITLRWESGTLHFNTSE